MFPKTWVARLRIAGYIEGASFLILLGIAMPLKYIAGQPEAVSMVGMVHGWLFILYLVVLAFAVSDGGWQRSEIAKAAGAAVVPFGPFLVDGMLRRIEQRQRNTPKTELDTI